VNDDYVNWVYVDPPSRKRKIYYSETTAKIKLLILEISLLELISDYPTVNAG